MHQSHSTKSHFKISPKKNTHSSSICKIFLAILLITIFEGAFRKWISSSLTLPLVFSRDALAIIGIIIGLTNAKTLFRKSSMQILLAWTALLIFWGGVQLIFNQSSLVTFIFGIRFWLLYLWFSYVAATMLTERDFIIIAKTFVIILIAMTPLVILQHLQSPGSFINKQVDGDSENVFMLAADVVRTTGTFSFTLGYAVFLSICLPFVFACMMPGFKIFKHKSIVWLSFLAAGIGTLVSGSRSSILFFIILLMIYVCSLFFFTKGGKHKIHAALFTFALLAALATLPFFFSRAIDATQERFDSAAQSEDFFQRVTSMFFGEQNTYTHISFLGEGFGAGSNAAAVAATGKRTFQLAETETSRTLLEGGLLGFIFIFLKLIAITFGLTKSFGIAKRSGNFLPLMLWTTTTIALLSWSLIGQLTVNSLGFLLLGLSVASLRFSLKKLT